jgi:iron-sulfur cluster assembly protein
MITITESASQKIKEMMGAEENASYLRVGVHPGGCSGFSYGMGFEEAKKEDDKELSAHGIRILVDPESNRYLNGTIIDYKQNMMGGGFTIDNPNAVVSCGCGSSFRTAQEEGTPEKCDD